MFSEVNSCGTRYGMLKIGCLQNMVMGLMGICRFMSSPCQSKNNKVRYIINSYNDGLNTKMLTVSIIAETYENGEFESEIPPILFSKIRPIFFSMKINWTTVAGWGRTTACRILARSATSSSRYNHETIPQNIGTLTGYIMSHWLHSWTRQPR